MDIFRVHQHLIDDYRLFTTSAIEPRDPRVSQHVADELAKQTQWPEPWLSLNPMFASGGSIDELAAADLLHASRLTSGRECRYPDGLAGGSVR